MTKAQHINLDHLESGVLLPCGYQPSPFTVIIGHGKEPKLNPGNQRLRILAQSFLQKYQYGDKKCKTNIVSDIIRMIRDVRGAFVKHSKNGRWYKQGNTVAREKVGYVFRDLLADQYKSSSKSKVARRQSVERQEKLSSALMAPSTTSLFGSATMIMDDLLESQQQQQRQQRQVMMGSYNNQNKASQLPFTCQPSNIIINGISDIMMRSGAFLDEAFGVSNNMLPRPPSLGNNAGIVSSSDESQCHHHHVEREFPSKRPSVISVEEVVDIMKKSGVFLEEDEQESEELETLPAFIETFSASLLHNETVESLENDPFFEDDDMVATKEYPSGLSCFRDDDAEVDFDSLLRMPLLSEYVTPTNRLPMRLT